MPGHIKQVFYRVRHARQRRQGALFPAQGVDIFCLGQHPRFGNRRPGVDLRVDARNIFQRLTGDFAGT